MQPIACSCFSQCLFMQQRTEYLHNDLMFTLQWDSEKVSPIEATHTCIPLSTCDCCCCCALLHLSHFNVNDFICAGLRCAKPHWSLVKTSLGVREGD